MEANKIQVVVRVRPLNASEHAQSAEPSVAVNMETGEVNVGRPGETAQARTVYRFPEAFDNASTQEEVFDRTLAKLIPQVVAGHDVACFAYGHTGTGKTWTVEGPSDVHYTADEDRGLVHRAADAIFKERPAGYAVTLSCLEIYNEELCDLLPAPVGPKGPVRLELKDDGRGVQCHGLAKQPVSSPSAVYNLVNNVQKRRQTAETRSNTRSSRSHCIFTLTTFCREWGQDTQTRPGRLHIVDLAGSEGERKVGPDFSPTAMGSPLRGGGGGLFGSPSPKGDRERERRNINQSLLTLGRVITMLRNGTKAIDRIPYRDSKLTRLLQQALGGRCQTVMICTVSPAASSVDETLATLNYADQASGIERQPLATVPSHLVPRSMSNDRLQPGGGALRKRQPSLEPVLPQTPQRPAVRGTAAAMDTYDRQLLQAQEAMLKMESTLSEQDRLAHSQERAQLEMRLAYVTQEHADAKLACQRQQKENEQLTVEKEQLKAKLIEAEGACADLKEAKECLKAELYDVRDVAKGAAGKLRQRDAGSWAVRSQVRTAFKAAEDRAMCLEEHARAVAASTKEHAEELHASHRVAIQATAKEYKHISDALSSQTRRQVADWGKAFDGAVSSARKAAAAGKASEAALFKDGEAAVGRLVTASTSSSSRVAATAVTALEGPLRARADELSENLRAGAASLPVQIRKAAQDIERFIQVAAETRRTGHSRNSGFASSFASLRDALQATVKEAEAHAAAAGVARNTVAKDADRAQAQREQVAEALRAATDTYVATTERAAPALEQAREGISTALSTRSEAGSVALASLATLLDTTKVNFAESGRRAEADVQSAVHGADHLLTSAWATSRVSIQNLEAKLQNVAARVRQDREVDERTLREALQDMLSHLSEVGTLASTLDSARQGIAQDLTELGKCHEAEQQAVGELVEQRKELLEQREALLDEIRHLHDEAAIAEEGFVALHQVIDALCPSLQRSCEEAKNRFIADIQDPLRAPLTASFLDTQPLLKALPVKMEQIFSEQLQALQQEFFDKSSKAPHLVRKISSVVKKVAGRCQELGQDHAAAGHRPERFLESVVKQRDVACVRAITDGDRIAKAAVELDEKVKLSQRLCHEVARVGCARSAACDEIVGDVESAATDALSLRDAQDSLLTPWREHSSAATAAASRCAKVTQASSDDLAVASRHCVTANQQLSALRSDAIEQVNAVTRWMAQHQAAANDHKNALAQWRSAEAQASSASLTANSRHTEALGSLHAEAVAVAQRTSAVMYEAVSLAEQDPGALCVEDRSLENLSQCTVTTTELASRVEAALGSAVQAAIALTGAQQEVARNVRRDEALAEEACSKAGSVVQAVMQSQRTALESAAALAAEPWSELEKCQESALAGVEQHLADAEAQAAALAQHGAVCASAALQRAEQAKLRTREALEDHAVAQATGLRAQAAQLREALAMEPLAAWAEHPGTENDGSQAELALGKLSARGERNRSALGDLQLSRLNRA